MKFDLSIPSEKRKADAYFTDLCGKRKTIELKRIDETRTLSQNSYLHVLIGAFADHFGYFPDEAKQIYKELNPDIYSYRREVRGITRTFWRSSSDITKEQMAVSIDRLMMASAHAGYELPQAEDHAWIRQEQNKLEQLHTPVEDEYR